MNGGIKLDQRQFADILFRGGPVYTVNQSNDVAAACATRGDRIIGCGGLADLLHLVGPATRIIDLEGKCLVPGLIDAHSHIVGQGLTMSAVDCKQGVESISDILERVTDAAKRLGPGAWVIGRGYNQNKLRESRHPGREDLDRAAPDNPVALTRTCGHIMAVNSQALALAGIGEHSADPPGGQIVRDASNRPTGLLLESAMRAVSELIAPTLESYIAAYHAACREYLGYGITSGHDASGADPLQVRAMIEGARDSTLRTYMMLRIGAEGAFAGGGAIAAGLVSGMGGTAMRVGPLKIMLDGSSSGPTAATVEPYIGQPESSGILYHDQDELNAIVRRGIESGFEMTAHCVGDRAVGMMLTALSRGGAKAGAGRRHRIEHCAMLNPGLVERIRELAVVPVANPAFLWEFGDGYVQDYGPERAGWMFPMRALIEAGIPVAAGSDAPVTTVDPFLGMYCAMTRKTSTGAVVGPEQAVTFAQALRAYTHSGAWSSSEESLKGSIEPGKLADLAVVEPDLGAAAPEDIRHARAVLTVLGGQVVYER